ncbi:diaminopimelate decarboxylase [bacterium]|nr:diaminopimelate decarboxylase [bacterium]
MKAIDTKDNQLYVEDIPVIQITKEYGSPAFIYSSKAINDNFQAYQNEIREGDLICYAVKANSNLHILKLLSDLGSGFDVVSGNELKRCLLAGADKNKIVFSGVAKTEEEITLAIENDILSINIESYGEFERTLEVSKELNKKVNCALRVNPDIAIGSHKYIQTGSKTSKFGLDKESVLKISSQCGIDGPIKLTSVASHIGSQISDENLILESVDYLIEIADELAKNGHNIEYLDIGGGLGIQYRNEEEGSPKILLEKVKKLLSERDFKIILEPGRSVIGNAGILVSKVEYIKEAGEKKFAIIDAGMNDLIRPSLYEAWHKVIEVNHKNTDLDLYDLAGPVCETGDVLAKDRNLKIMPGDHVAFMDVGAYGSVMTSNYNSRLRPIELLVTKDKVQVIKRKESFEDIVALET